MLSLDATDEMDRLVRQYEGMAHYVTRDLFGPGLDREDLLQEARIGIARGVRDFNGHGNLTGFLGMCARRAAVDAVETARRQKHRALAEADSLYQENEDGETYEVELPGGRDPLDVVIAREYARQVIECVATRLTSIEREALLAFDSSRSSDPAPLRCRREGHRQCAATCTQEGQGSRLTVWQQRKQKQAA